MTSFLQILLIAHIIFGLLGVIAFYAVWMGLLKHKPSPRFLKFSSLWGFIALVLSWFTGGYYYVAYYGTTVKPVIKAGGYPWAHALFMEAKEHVFLLLPFLAAVVALVIWFWSERMETETATPLGSGFQIKRSLVLLSGLITVLGIIITLAG